MRIGLLSYEYPPQKGLGGVGSYMFRLAGALGRAGHEVVVLAGPRTGPETQQANVTVHRIEARYDPPVAFPGLRWLYWHGIAPLLQRANPIVWHWLRWDLASGPALREIHLRTPLDVIEAPEHAANGLFSWMVPGVPLVLRTHGPWDLFFGINRNYGMAMNRLLVSLERRSAKQARIITAPSRAMAKFIQKHWALKRRPTVVPNFIDVPEEAPPLPEEGDEQRIVCAGRIEPFKGQDVLVRAFAQVAQRHPRARLVLIGPDQWCGKGSFAQRVDEMIHDRSIRTRVELTGPRPLHETQAAIASAAIAVVPSTGFESFSFSTLEAMALARPLIVARSGAMPELVDYGRCAKVFKPGDAVALASALDSLLSDRTLREKLSAAAHTRARREYDTQAALPGFVAAYERAIAAVPPRGETSPRAVEVPNHLATSHERAARLRPLESDADTADTAQNLAPSR